MLLRELMGGGPGIPKSLGPLNIRSHFGSDVKMTGVHDYRIVMYTSHLDSLPTSPLTSPPRCTLVKLSPSLEYGVPPLQASFEVLRGSTLLPCLAHSLGTLVQFVTREGRAPASVRVVRLERDGRRGR